MSDHDRFPATETVLKYWFEFHEYSTIDPVKFRPPAFAFVPRQILNTRTWDDCYSQNRPDLMSEVIAHPTPPPVEVCQ